MKLRSFFTCLAASSLLHFVSAADVTDKNMNVDDALKCVKVVYSKFNEGEINHILLGSGFSKIVNSMDVSVKEKFSSRSSKIAEEDIKTNLEDPYLKSLKAQSIIAYYDIISYDPPVASTLSDLQAMERTLRLHAPLLKSIQKLIVPNYKPAIQMNDSSVNLSGVTRSDSPQVHNGAPAGDEPRKSNEAPPKELSPAAKNNQQSALRDMESLLVPIYQERLARIKKADPSYKGKEIDFFLTEDPPKPKDP